MWSGTRAEGRSTRLAALLLSDVAAETIAERFGAEGGPPEADVLARAVEQMPRVGPAALQALGTARCRWRRFRANRSARPAADDPHRAVHVAR